MSETEKAMDFPPIDVFQCEPNGLMKWRPVMDIISVDVTSEGVWLKAHQGAASIVFWLNFDEAAHIAKLLFDARQKFADGSEAKSENRSDRRSDPFLSKGPDDE